MENFFSLPIKDGGIGIRNVNDIGLPFFLSSVNSTRQLIHYVLSVYDPDENNVSFYNDALDECNRRYRTVPLKPAIQKKTESIYLIRKKTAHDS